MNLNKNLNDGILLLNKPKYKTSSQTILAVKNKLNLNKIGHAGTLDPLATGLIVALVNKATKLSDYLLTSNKEYIVTMKLFIETNTYDILGKIVKINLFRIFSKKQLKAVFNIFNNFSYLQYPPMYSAIKYKGKKLYEYARKNIDVSIKPRIITIKKIKINFYIKKQGLINFYVKCSKGTYVRSLVQDIAKKLNTIALVYDLHRVASGNFKINKAIDINNVTINNMISMYDSLRLNNFPIVEYHNEQTIKNGRMIHLVNHNENIIFIKNNKSNEIIAIYRHLSNNNYKCIRGI